MRWCLTLGVLTAATAVAAQEKPITKGPQYPEQGAGQSMVWFSVGPTGWFTDRAPHQRLIPASIELGYGHQIGVARLAWGIRLAHDFGQSQTSFLSVDLVSVERVYPLRWCDVFLRGGLALGLDLEAQTGQLGEEGYFNADNGTTGGFGLTLGAGLDKTLYGPFFLRLAGGASAYGGVGQTALLWSGRVGVGIRY